MNAKKVIFMGSKPVGYECLKVLINRDDVEIMGVLTKDKTKDVWWNDKYRVYDLAVEFNIPILHLRNILDLDIDFIFSVQYHKILDKEILNHPEYGAINLHMAPLPEYRGCNQFSFAIINQEKEFGTTLHYMDEGVDSGDIISEKRFEIHNNIRVNELYNITEKKSVELFEESLSKILNLNNNKTSQDKLINKRDCNLYKRSDINEIKEIDLNWNEERIYRYIRALDFPPFEPPYFKANDKKVYLTFGYCEGRR